MKDWFTRPKLVMVSSILIPMKIPLMWLFSNFHITISIPCKILGLMYTSPHYVQKTLSLQIDTFPLKTIKSHLQWSNLYKNNFPKHHWITITKQFCPTHPWLRWLYYLYHKPNWVYHNNYFKPTYAHVHTVSLVNCTVWKWTLITEKLLAKLHVQAQVIMEHECMDNLND